MGSRNCPDISMLRQARVAPKGASPLSSIGLLMSMTGMLLPTDNYHRDDSYGSQERKNNIEQIESLHFHSFPLSITKPAVNSKEDNNNPAISNPTLNPEIKGPIISVATQILLRSSKVFPRFSSCRFVNFINLNIPILTAPVKQLYLGDWGIRSFGISPITQYPNRLKRRAASPAVKNRNAPKPYKGRGLGGEKYFNVWTEWKARGSLSGVYEEKRHNVGLLLDAFNIPHDSLVIEHGLGKSFPTVIPAAYMFRLGIDWDRTESTEKREVIIKDEVANTAKIIEERLPEGWPTVPQSIIWCNFWHYLKGYGPEVYSAEIWKGEEEEQIRQNVADQALHTVSELLPPGGVFIVIENEREDLNQLKEHLGRLQLPFFKPCIVEHNDSEKTCAFVFEKKVAPPPCRLSPVHFPPALQWFMIPPPPRRWNAPSAGF